jgi:hypothetical protein
MALDNYPGNPWWKEYLERRDRAWQLRQQGHFLEGRRVLQEGREKATVLAEAAKRDYDACGEVFLNTPICPGVPVAFPNCNPLGLALDDKRRLLECYHQEIQVHDQECRVRQVFAHSP